MALAALGWLGWQIMFGDFQPFEVEAFWIGAVATIACLADPGAVRRFPAALVLYVLAAVVSSFVHNWHDVNRDGVFAWSLVFGPVDYLLYMLVFVFGAAYVLRTRQRQAWFVVLLSAAIVVLAGQLLFDRAVSAFVYNRADRTFIPSVSQWSGLHQLGLVFVVGLPLCLSVSLARSGFWSTLSGLVLAAFLMGVGWINGSKSSILIMGVLPLLIGAALLVSHRTGRVTLRTSVAAIVAALCCGMAVFAVSGMAFTSLTGDRAPIWNAAWHMFLDHPWFGVGPRGYSDAVQLGGYAEQFIPWFPENRGGTENAHNLALQTAVETGLVGVVSLMWFFVWAARSSYVARGGARAVSFAVSFAIVGLGLRFLFDNFWALDFFTDRIKPFAWFLFAAAVALARLPERESA